MDYRITYLKALMKALDISVAELQILDDETLIVDVHTQSAAERVANALVTEGWDDVSIDYLSGYKRYIVRGYVSEVCYAS